jgi:hypothetical protein
VGCRENTSVIVPGGSGRLDHLVDG